MVYFGCLLLLAPLLASDLLRHGPWPIPWFESGRQALVGIFNDHSHHTLITAIIIGYLLVFLFLNHRGTRPHGSTLLSTLGRCWEILALIGVALATDVRHSSVMGPSSDFLVLAGGMLLGQVCLFLNTWFFQGNRSGLYPSLFLAYLTILALAVLCPVPAAQTFLYRGVPRLTGYWYNPNSFGLLLGISLLFTWGFLLQPRPPAVAARFTWRWNAGIALTLLLGWGLIHTYSRGAWLGTGLGLAYLFHSRRSLLWRGQDTTSVSQSAPAVPGSAGDALDWGRAHYKPLLVIACLLGVIVFWCFRDSEQRIVRRSFSWSNPNDFSWRNRLIAYQGGLQIMGEKPWAGWGWDAPERVYGTLYKPVEIEDARAILLNDYFMIGMTLGIPALGVLLHLIFKAFPVTNAFPSAAPPLTESSPRLWFQAMCRAGVIVLLTGFFLDRGLLLLPLATCFWILLALGKPVPAKQGQPHTDQRLLVGEIVAP